MKTKVRLKKFAYSESLRKSGCGFLEFCVCVCVVAYSFEIVL